jgi:LmbE family N-acetylglucosaminyl deacetylase
VSITSGQKGVAHNNLEPGEALGAIREEELRCAAKQLGIHEPFFLRFQDQGISSLIVMERVAERLRDVINQTRPDVVITFGAGGVTGHIDHIVAGEITTQVFQNQSLLRHKPRKLYYVAFPESRMEHAPPRLRQRRLHLLSDCFITAEIDCSDFLEPAHRAMQCHKTQFPPEFLEQLRQMHRSVFGGHIFLRLALACPPRNGAHETCILEGL